MKPISTRLFAALLATFFFTNFAVAQIDNSSEDGTHVLGNGQLCVYGWNTDIIQLFGPPYSSSSVFQMQLKSSLEVSSTRVPGAAVWNHTLFNGTKKAATYTDFVDADINCYIRQMKMNETVEHKLNMTTDDYWLSYHGDKVTARKIDDNTGLKDVNQVYMITVAPNFPYFSNYASSLTSCYKIIATGSVTIEPADSIGWQYYLKGEKGEGALIVATGNNEAEADAEIAKIAASSVSSLHKKTKKSWSAYTAGRKNIPSNKQLRQAVDDVDVLIRCQQGADGGVLAGVFYHMAYVRDQYGVSRAQLAMGRHDGAKAILDFYYGIWKKHGFIKNAQPIGVDAAFHCHENDDVEITAYLVIQAFDYYRATGNKAYLRKIVPMLEWAMDVQRKHVVDGMLPFNGDETYIAGGVLPRKVIDEGSAEATLLFIEGGERLLAFAVEEQLWSAPKTAEWEGVIGNCKSLYRKNFFSDGKLYINNPDRTKNLEYMPTRPGICLHPEHPGFSYNLQHFKGSLYFCPDCMKRDNSNVVVPEPERFNITSAYLFPFYINAQLFTPDEKAMLLEVIIDKYNKTDKISDGDRILGYDYGLFLYALTASGNELAHSVYQRMMALRDKTGAWVEYYNEGKPNGCQCRPWESGINIEAAIEHVNNNVKK